MPKGQQRKIKGAICNVPVECDKVCNILPHPPERSGIILLKLKRKLQFRGHVYFQAVRPEFVKSALTWLKVNNPLCKDIMINCENISVELTTMTQTNKYSNLLNSINSESTSETAVNIGDSCEFNSHDNSELNSFVDVSNNNRNTVHEDEVDDPLNEHRSAANETCLQAVIPDYPILTEENQSNISSGREIYNIAPGENEHPVSLMTDKLCEELAFPVLFPNGRFGFYC